jgi:hypothetical protein
METTWDSFAGYGSAATSSYFGGQIQHPTGFQMPDTVTQDSLLESGSSFIEDQRVDGEEEHDDGIPDGFVGDEEEVEPRAQFASPRPPLKGWTQLDEVVQAFKEAADACCHRFIICCTTSGHLSKKLGTKVTDHAFLYCKCSKSPPTFSGPKPHSRSYCPWQVKLKFDKVKLIWSVVSSVDHHICPPRPNYSVTATGMRMLRTKQDLTSAELSFIHDQFDNVGTYPRLIQWNFSRKFTNRKPISGLISSLRLEHHEQQYGLHTDNVIRLKSTLENHKAHGGVGEVEWDAMLQISRLVVMRPEMVPFLKKYGRILICDATHGITMAKFRLFTVVVVDSLLHSTLVAYAFVRTEAAHELTWIFKSLGLERGDVVFISDDNPAARILCAEFNWVHILCQWHYARNWVKACTKARISKQEQFHFGTTLFDLMTSVDFTSEEDFMNQLSRFCDAVVLRSGSMKEWAGSFSNDIKLVAEWFRKGLYTAGAPFTRWYTM